MWHSKLFASQYGHTNIPTLCPALAAYNFTTKQERSTYQRSSRRHKDPLSSMEVPPDMSFLDEVNDPDGWRARRRSEKKAAKVLGIPFLDDTDLEPGHCASHAEGEGTAYSAQDGRRGSLSQLNLASLSLREPARMDTQHSTGSEEAVPLLGSASRGARRNKAHRRLGRHLLSPFRLARTKGRKLTRSRHDEEDIEWEEAQAERAAQADTEGDVEMAEEDEPVGQGSPGGAQAEVPYTPRRKVRYASAPATPRTSPPSARSRRSTSSWQRTTPRTPLSAKSWRTDGSPGSDFSPGSGGSTLQRRNKRRRARELVSQTKCLQLLGPEASGAVARATNVKETKLRYRDFGRQLHERFRRDL
ncbi:hypothetical protein C2E23DRAFT_877557 [Lenzites betulinus]|nr:hypothetical protein C2E23DRAFT_877557 [Lenzites betulinus]